ncbi:MAG: hypothetical protein NZ924_02075 [Candidatus Bipolaricaulota bacterium]|nr:hypothetical protein [Candidatus Bipolaricaulota bacterium]MDW8151698.1 sugar-binding protein [Candidatus Bipolaricaulota bacterium]
MRALKWLVGLLAIWVSAGQALEAIAWRAPGPVVIDGALNEWITSDPIIIKDAKQAIVAPYLWGGSLDCSVTVYVMWDEENLYIAAEIFDDVPFTARAGFRPDEADSLGVYLSTNPQANPVRKHYEATDFRILLMIDGYEFNTAIDRDMLTDPKGIETAGMYGDEQVLSGYEAAAVPTKRGCIFEAKIPFKALSNEQIPVFVPRDGVKVGFNIEINDIDMPCPGIGAKTLAWTGTEAIRQNPSEWGVLIFRIKR